MLRKPCLGSMKWPCRHSSRQWLLHHPLVTWIVQCHLTCEQDEDFGFPWYASESPGDDTCEALKTTAIVVEMHGQGLSFRCISMRAGGFNVEQSTTLLNLPKSFYVTSFCLPAHFISFYVIFWLTSCTVWCIGLWTLPGLIIKVVVLAAAECQKDGEQHLGQIWNPFASLVHFPVSTHAS